jgi:hypothetical protein
MLPTVHPRTKCKLIGLSVEAKEFIEKHIAHTEIIGTERDDQRVKLLSIDFTVMSTVTAMFLTEQLKREKLLQGFDVNEFPSTEILARHHQRPRAGSNDKIHAYFGYTRLSPNIPAVRIISFGAEVQRVKCA